MSQSNSGVNTWTSSTSSTHVQSSSTNASFPGGINHPRRPSQTGMFGATQGHMTFNQEDKAAEEIRGLRRDLESNKTILVGMASMEEFTSEVRQLREVMEKLIERLEPPCEVK